MHTQAERRYISTRSPDTDNADTGSIGGIFREKGVSGWIIGTIIAGVARFLFHFVSGVVIRRSFGELRSGFSTDNTYLYSLLYNGAYMLPEIIFTVIGAAALFSVPQTKRIITGSQSAGGSSAA